MAYPIEIFSEFQVPLIDEIECRDDLIENSQNIILKLYFLNKLKQIKDLPNGMYQELMFLYILMTLNYLL